MTPNSVPADVRGFWPVRSQQGLAGLLVFGWTGTLVSIILAIVVSFFLFGYFTPYWRRADMDIMLVYQAFLLGAGHAQDFFDHPAHLNILLIDAWFRLFHHIGALDIVSLAQMPPASDQPAFDQAWTAGVRAGRLLSLVLVTSFVGLFAVLLRRLVVDWRVAALATLMLAFSSGIMWHARVIRTDMLSAGLEILGLLLLLLAARSPGSLRRPIVVGLAAMLCTLGFVDKVQAVAPALAWSVVVMFFGVRAGGPEAFWRPCVPAFVAVIVLAVLTGLAAIPVAHLIDVGLSAKASSIFPLLPPPFGINGLYQAIVAGWVLCAVIIYAWLWRVPLLETIATLLAVCLGAALGLLSLELRYHPQTVIEVVNPIELMFYFGSAASPQIANGKAIAGAGLIWSLVLGFLDVLARLTYVLHTSSRATMFLEWVVLAGICMAWVRGQRVLAVQVTILVLAAWGIDTLATLRSLKLEYSVFSDPVVVIAAAWLFANLPELKSHRLAFPIGALLIAAHLVMSQVEPAKLVLARAGPEIACGWLPLYAKLIDHFPFCPPRT